MKLFSHIQTFAKSIKRKTMVLWFAARHPETPILAKLIAFFALAYALSPIDLIPDFIPVLGYLDDMILLPLLIWMALKMCPNHVIDECQQKSDDWWALQQKRPVSIVGLIAIIIIWLCLASLFGVWIYRIGIEQ